MVTCVCECFQVCVICEAERVTMVTCALVFPGVCDAERVSMVTCVRVFPGELCEEKLDFCAPELNPCQHDSKCILTLQGYK